VTDAATALAATPVFSTRAEAARRRLLRPWAFRAYLLGRLPLAAAAGLRMVRLDERECVVRLPGGWRTRNPFGSAYFAAQAMAAEMSTGAPAMILAQGAAVSVALILREIRGVFTRRILGPSTFTFADVAGLAAVVEQAAASGEPLFYVGRSLGQDAEGARCAEFEVTWSFKRRGGA
jgi:acyl-coenzyme A thioesterase PaaI-like protein